MNDTKKKRQHYVPQCYLNHFSNETKHINVFDKDIEKTFVSPTLDVAREQYFYDFPELNVDEFIKLNPHYSEEEIEEVKYQFKLFGEGQAVENGFSIIETEFSDLLNSTINKCMAKEFSTSYKKKEFFSYKEKRKMANFIALQIIRTKEFRLFQSEILSILLQNKVKKACPEELDNYRNEGLKDDIKKFESMQQAAFMGRPEYLKEIMNPLFQRFWAIGINKTSKSLYTSDNPVAYYSREKAYRYKVRFLVQSDLVAYPLNGKFILLMYKKQPKDNCIMLYEDSIKFYNELQVKCSTRQVFSKDNDFVIAKNIMNKYGDQYRSTRLRPLS